MYSHRMSHGGYDLINKYQMYRLQISWEMFHKGVSIRWEGAGGAHYYGAADLNILY